ncbi:MAG: hypothetical protein M1834_008112 [Cirrosporium novae-zelandiae]|nr:MAG: hypothetical protein M1834_008112 [Cirrosporium novae-zelandiae]
MGLSLGFKLWALPKEYPDDKAIHAALQSFKTLRLKALELEPSAFASTYEREIAFTDDIWIDQKWDPSRCQAEWSAMIAIVGPIPSNSGTLVGKAPDCHRQSNVDAKFVLQFLINGLFVLPTARYIGLGQALIQAALEATEQDEICADAPCIKVTVLVHPSNTAARKLYEKCGFRNASIQEYEVRTGTKRMAVSLEYDIYPNRGGILVPSTDLR